MAQRTIDRVIMNKFVDKNRDRYVDSEGVGGREASIDKTERLSNR